MRQVLDSNPKRRHSISSQILVFLFTKIYITLHIFDRLNWVQKLHLSVHSSGRERSNKSGHYENYYSTIFLITPQNNSAYAKGEKILGTIVSSFGRGCYDKLLYFKIFDVKKEYFVDEFLC